jgi:hypothetical protein
MNEQRIHLIWLVLPHSELQTLLRDRKVARVEVSAHQITGELAEPHQAGAPVRAG